MPWRHTGSPWVAWVIESFSHTRARQTVRICRRSHPRAYESIFGFEGSNLPLKLSRQWAIDCVISIISSPSINIDCLPRHPNALSGPKIIHLYLRLVSHRMRSTSFLQGLNRFTFPQIPPSIGSHMVSSTLDHHKSSRDQRLAVFKTSYSANGHSLGNQKSH